MILYFYLDFFNYDLFAIYIFPNGKFDGKYTLFHPATTKDVQLHDYVEAWETHLPQHNLMCFLFQASGRFKRIWHIWEFVTVTLRFQFKTYNWWQTDAFYIESHIILHEFIKFVKSTEEKFAGLALEILKKIRYIKFPKVYNLFVT